VTAPSNAPAVRPIYFPQTFLPPAALKSLQPLFQSVTVLQPAAGGLPDEMQPFAESGFLKVLCAGTGSGCEDLLRDFHGWGDRHHGGIGVAAAWRQGRLAADAFGGEGSPFEIAAAIRRGSGAAEPAAAADPLRDATLFLQLAQTADRQQYQISRALHACDLEHHRLFDSLRGETGPQAADVQGGQPGCADHMPERMAAWARVFLSRPTPATTVFVSHHPGALEWLRERSPEPLRVALAALPEMLRASPAGTAPGGADTAALLSALDGRPLNPEAYQFPPDPRLPAVSIWPETPPLVFIARLLRSDVEPTAQGPGSGRHTFVVQMP
jgi:hypothetical protein